MTIVTVSGSAPRDRMALMKKTLIFSLFSLILAPSLLWAAEKPSEKIEIIGKTHTISAVNRFSGPGSNVPNLINAYDMSLLEMNWGGRQATFNGSGITTNTNFPHFEGEALTNNTQIGLKAPVSDALKAGFLMELYTLIGDRNVGRVSGSDIIWGSFPRENGSIEAPHFDADIYNAFLESDQGPFKWRFVGGSLTPTELPEFTRKEMNNVKLGSLVYRTPVVNSSYLEKEDHRLVSGRHPLRGFDFIGDTEYAEKKHVHLELFTGATYPTPVADIERDGYGGRAAVDILDGNVGFSYVYNDGIRATTGFGENQGVWAIDSSYKLMAGVTPYFTFAQTDYERENTRESHRGNAYVAGLSLKHPQGYELKGQYQRLEENYNLMAYHKVEHYPTNFDGLNIEGTLPVSDTFKLKGVLYFLEQLDTVTTTADTLFGDSYFVSAAGSDSGTISVARLAGEWKPVKELVINGYVENAKFRKTAATATASIDKDVYNYHIDATWNLTKEWYVEGGYRHFFSVGNWQTMNFRSYENIYEGGMGYKIDKDKRATFIYHYLDFDDNNGASAGLNDYKGHQFIVEVKTLL